MLNSWCRDASSKQSFVTPYKPQHNAGVERFMRIPKEPATIMMEAAEIPIILCPFAILTAANIRNRLRNRSLGNISPYEMLKSIRPALSYIRTFDCIAYLMLQSGQRGPAPCSDWDDKSRPNICVGYSSISPDYIVIFPELDTSMTSMYVVFDEAAIWKWDSPL